MKLETCAACRGFVPPSIGACPHCNTKRGRIGATLAVLGSGAIAFTLMACYGAAPAVEGSPPSSPNSPSPDTSATTPTPPDDADAGK